jgi:two-component system, OmpR family, sensor histidine kinase TctE
MPARAPDLPRSLRPGRFGIPARLLALLLPGVLALLAFDSWNDYRALKDIVETAYDQALLESVTALDSSMTLAADGTIRVNPPFDVPDTSDPVRPRYQQLHVGLVAIAAGAAEPAGPDGPTAPATRTGKQAAGPETALLGVSDLPPVPPFARQASPERHERWYDGVYHGHSVRVVALRRTLLDGHGKPFQLLIQAAESTGPREQAAASTLRRELLRDARMLALVILLVWLGVGWSLGPLQRLRKSVLASPARRPGAAGPCACPVRGPALGGSRPPPHGGPPASPGTAGRFLADASHQLRTPLAILLTQAGYALRESDVGRMPVSRKGTSHPPRWWTSMRSRAR